MNIKIFDHLSLHHTKYIYFVQKRLKYLNKHKYYMNKYIQFKTQESTNISFSRGNNNKVGCILSYNKISINEN